MANWYMKGQSEYVAANFHMGFYIDHSGFPEGDYDTRNMESHGQTSDPFMAFGIDTGPATWTYGQQQVEIGLLKSHRIKFDTGGVYKWAGPGQDDWTLLGAGGGGNLGDLDDVVIDGTPADNELLAWDNGTSKWINQTAAEAGLAASGEPHVLATSGPHTGALPLTDIASYVQGSIIKGGVGDWEALGLGTESYVLKAGASEPAWGQVAWGEVTGKPTEFTPAAHILSPATGPHTGTLLWTELSKTGSSLADLATRTHASLSDAPTDAHHNKQHAMDDITQHTRGDNAVLDASTTYHGFLKKLDNVATNFMNGQGNWSVPAGTYSLEVHNNTYHDPNYLANLVEDTNPQLGGTLDCQKKHIDQVGLYTPLQVTTTTTGGWYKIGQLTSLGGRVTVIVHGTQGYGAEDCNGWAIAQFCEGNADDEFGGSYYCLGQIDPYTSFEWVDAGVNTMDCYVYVGTYFRGSIQIIEGIDFTLNATATTKLTDPSGTDLTEEWRLWSDMTVNGNIAVTGTVDGVDIATRDHAEAHVLATTGPHTGTLPWGDLSKTGSSLADLVTRAHSDLSDAPTSAHHVKYTHAEAVQAVEDAGLVLSDTKVITSQDANLNFTFGRVALGFGGGDQAVFAHRDKIGTTTFCLKHTADGYTRLNAQSATEIQFSIGNVEKLELTATLFTSGVPIAMGTNKITGLGDGTAAQDAMAFGQKYTLEQHALDSATYHTINANTTFNATITKHGFLKLLDNVATNFMNGQGNWSVPAGTYVDADAVQAVEDAGLVLSATKVITSADADLSFTFGRAAVGYIAGDRAMFAHRDNADAGSYALRQDVDGNTHVNAKTGQKVWFKVNNGVIGSIDASGLLIGSDARITEFDTSALANSDTKVPTNTTVKEYVDLLKEKGTTFPVSPSEGDLHYDTLDEAVYRYSSDALAWIQIGGSGGGSQGGITLDQAFDNGKIINGANSEANALQVGDANSLDRIKIWNTATAAYIKNLSGSLSFDVHSSLNIKTGGLISFSMDGDTDDFLYLDTHSNHIKLFQNTATTADERGYIGKDYDIEITTKPFLQIYAHELFDDDGTLGSYSEVDDLQLLRDVKEWTVRKKVINKNFPEFTQKVWDKETLPWIVAHPNVNVMDVGDNNKRYQSSHGQKVGYLLSVIKKMLEKMDNMENRIIELEGP